MNANKAKTLRRTRRRMGMRKRIRGTPDRPRLSIFKSLNNIYVQVIDDLAGRTLASASSSDLKDGSTGNVEASKAVGKLIAERAKSAGVSEVVFDRGGFRYHGRVKALADAAREGGLKF